MIKLPKKISIVIPAFNEADNFRRGVLDEVKDYLENQDYSWEVILVNDGSTDETLKLIEDFSRKNSRFKIIDISHGGKVAAVTAGVKAANGEYILFTDFDQSTPINEVEKILEKFEKGADVVIGKRVGKTGWSFSQRLRSIAFNLLVQIIALPGVTDTQCGFKAFKNNIGKKLFEELKVTFHTQKGGYMGAFDVELLFLARKHGFLIKTIPVSWEYFESGRLSVTEPIKMLIDIVKVRLTDIFSGYDYVKSKQHIGFRFHLIPLILLFLLTIPAFRDTIAPGYFPMHDDLQATRQLLIDKCFKDGQFPCRWSLDLGYGYGYPLFNFYPPLPYYIGQVIHWVGFSFLDTVKILVILNFVISGLTMYLLAQAFWGRWGGLVAGIFYIYAPYHAVDVYVRGAINEAWALTWFPAIFWGLYRLIVTNKWYYVPFLAFFTALLMLSHNPMLMIFTPSVFIWGGFWLLVKRNFKVLPKLVASGIWALGLAAFFTLPVIFEQKYAHVESLISGYFNYLAHFATVSELFISTKWGFGSSELGPVDGLSFQIGYLHWILALISLITAILIFKKKRSVSLMIFIVFFMTLFYTFMSHERSSFIWSRISSLQYLQFPWRFLTMSIFGTSFLAGSIAMLFHMDTIKRLKVPAIAVLILTTIVLYQDYFRWRTHYPDMKDQDKFSGATWKLQITSGIFDYLPIWAPLPPANPPRGDANFYGGVGHVEKIFKNSIKQKYQVSVKKPGVFQLETFYFPGWKYFVDNKEISVDPTEDKELGRPRINLVPGEHLVVAKFTNTPVRTFGNSVSLISWLVLLGLLIYKPVRKLTI